MSQALLAALQDDIMVAKNGDHQAFAKLVEATQNLTTSIALSIVKDVEASEDVAQQVYIKVWQQLPSLNKENSFLPWLRQITRYTAVSYLRNSKAGQRVNSETAESILADLVSEGGDLLEQVNHQQATQILSHFIEALPDESRELVLLYYREEESTQQVSQLLELSESNVRKKLSRARQQIKAEWLKKYGKLVLTTAPGIGFTTLMMNLVTASSPVAAATMAASVSAGKTGVWAKLLALLGGVFAGAGAGILAVLISTKVLMSRLQDPSYIDEIKRNRNRMIAWIVFCSVLLAISYELTSGWWAPVLSYALFALGLVRLVELTQLLAAQAGCMKAGRFCIDPAKRSWKVRVLNWAGPAVGGASLLFGLYSSGRLLG